LAGPKLPSRVSPGPLVRTGACRSPVDIRGPRNYGSAPRPARARGVPKTSSRATTVFPNPRRRRPHIRSAHGCLLLRYATRGRSALPPGHHRSEHLQRSMPPGIWQPMPVLLSGRSLRNGCNTGRVSFEDSRVELRALQDLRHCRSLPNHQLGAARGRWRTVLRGHVRPGCAN
jgi:hypothetical protein